MSPNNRWLLTAADEGLVSASTMRTLGKLVSIGVLSLFSLASFGIRGAELVVTGTHAAPRSQFSNVDRLQVSSIVTVTNNAVVVVLTKPPAGIGVLIGSAKEGIYIHQVVQGTPTWNAGVREGDVIIAIGPAPTRDIALYDAALQLRGQVGTEIELTLKRQFTERTFKATLKREVVKTPPDGFRL